MEDRTRREGMSEEQFEEAQRLFEVTQQAVADEQWRICCMMASQKDRQMLGANEFKMRDPVHRIGAIVLEAAINGRKKRATKAVASLALAAMAAPVSTVGAAKHL